MTVPRTLSVSLEEAIAADARFRCSNAVPLRTRTTGVMFSVLCMSWTAQSGTCWRCALALDLGALMAELLDSRKSS